jgi:hypothetical protein
MQLLLAEEYSTTTAESMSYLNSNEYLDSNLKRQHH